MERNKDILEEIERCAQDHPFDTVLVAFTQSLPHGFLLGGLSCYAYSCASTIWSRWILLDLTEFDPLGRDVVPGVGKIEHTPECSIGIWLADLEQGQVGGIGGGEGELVDG